MKRGQVEKAERLALNEFDKWNDVTGFVQEDTGYYYELQAVITDAVHIGIQMATNGKVNFNKEGILEKESEDLDFEDRLSDALKSHGYLFPETDKQMDKFEKSMEMLPVPEGLETPDLNYKSGDKVKLGEEQTMILNEKIRRESKAFASQEFLREMICSDAVVEAFRAGAIFAIKEDL